MVLHFDMLKDTKLAVSGVEGVRLTRRGERKGSERRRGADPPFIPKNDTRVSQHLGVSLGSIEAVLL